MAKVCRLHKWITGFRQQDREHTVYQDRVWIYSTYRLRNTQHRSDSDHDGAGNDEQSAADRMTRFPSHPVIHDSTFSVGLAV